MRRIFASKAIGQSDRFRSFLLSTIVLLSILPTVVSAQIGIDVKTSWSEKKSLHALKLGLLTAIEATTWGKNREFGEDYAVWIGHPERTFGDGNTIVLRVPLELRTPSLLQQGELLASDVIELRYRKETLDSLLAIESGRDAVEKLGEGHRMIDQVITVVGEVLPIGNPLVRPVIIALAHKLNEGPDEAEGAEALLFALQGVQSVEQMIRSL